MITFVSSSSQIQEAEPIRNMKAKFLEKCLIYQHIFSKHYLQLQMLPKSMRGGRILLTIKEVLLAIMLTRPPRHIVTINTSHMDLYMVIFIWLHLIQALGVYFVIILSWSILQEVTLLKVQMFCESLPEVYFYGHSGHLLTPTLKLFQTEIIVAKFWGSQSPIYSCAGINSKLFLEKILAYSSVLAQLNTL